MLEEMQGYHLKWGCQGRASEGDGERCKAGEGVSHMQVWGSVPARVPDVGNWQVCERSCQGILQEMSEVRGLEGPRKQR